MTRAMRGCRKFGLNLKIWSAAAERSVDAALDRIAVANTIAFPDRKIQSAVKAGALQI